jgi:hypothetical protein
VFYHRTINTLLLPTGYLNLQHRLLYKSYIWVLPSYLLHLQSINKDGMTLFAKYRPEVCDAVIYAPAGEQAKQLEK